MSPDALERATVAPTDLVLVRHSGLRVVEAAEVLAGLDADLVRLPRLDAHIDARPFAEHVDAGSWHGQIEYLRRSADRVKQLSDSSANPALHYFGLAEIAHVIALGALLGDERRVHLHEFDRDKGTWAWPSAERTLTVGTTGLPAGAPVTSHGSAVVRVSISANISDADVREVAGDEHLADISLTVTDGSPAITTVRSMEDLEQIRLAFRAAIAALASSRPNLDLIELFVAAPVSVCFAIGQELKARNSVPIQTYRFRTVTGQSRYQPALLIGEASLQATPLPPTSEEAAKAERARSGPLATALDDVLNWAKEQRAQGAEDQPWFRAIPVPEVAAASLFPGLPALRVVVADGARLDGQSPSQEYVYDKDSRLWGLSDRLVLGWQAVFGHDAALRRAGRLFFFHEYVHDYQTLTASTAREVGKFGSVLEHIDYVADAYALVHELGLTIGSASAEERTQVKAILDTLLETMLSAMWAFAPLPGSPEWEVRRLRRFLNWYWRQIQIRRTPSLAQAVRLLGRVPRIEIGGVQQIARGRRIIARLDRRDPTTHLELGLVLEDERLFRLGDSANTSLAALLAAFQHARHQEIQAFFKSAFEFAQQTGGALPG